MDAGTFKKLLRDMPVITPGMFLCEPTMILSPHPDDESLGTGGLIAASAASGVRLDVVIVTDGAGSHPRSALYPAPRLTALRRQEATQAAAILGVPSDRLHHLDVPDTKVPVEGKAFDDLVERVAALANEAGTKSLLVTWNADPHCDHEATAAVARAVRERHPTIALWYYPIWGWHLEPDASVEGPPPDGFRIDIAPWLETKRAAVAAHRSQMTDLIPDDPHGFRFTPETLEPFLRPYEYVFRVPR